MCRFEATNTQPIAQRFGLEKVRCARRPPMSFHGTSDAVEAQRSSMTVLSSALLGASDATALLTSRMSGLLPLRASQRASESSRGAKDNTAIRNRIRQTPSLDHGQVTLSALTLSVTLSTCRGPLCTYRMGGAGCDTCLRLEKGVEHFVDLVSLSLDATGNCVGSAFRDLKSLDIPKAQCVIVRQRPSEGVPDIDVVVMGG
jgi:hypothetical protein